MLERIVSFFRQQHAVSPLAAIGIGSFGPVSRTQAGPTTDSLPPLPSPAGMNVDLAGTVQRALGLPVGFDTDVNVAALGEWRWGAAQDLDTFIYVTVGTGVGGGGLSNGRMMHGLVHPEMGHILLPRRPRGRSLPRPLPLS